jgi:conjugal transfer pilus assembly protein TraF
MAVDNPTPENVEAYFLLQRLALDRASKFGEMQQRVVMGNPFIDEEGRRSQTSFGGQQLDAFNRL